MNERSIAAFAIALASCSRGPAPAMPPDASVDAAIDAPLDAPGPPPNTVIGRSFTRCHQIGGDVEVPDNLSVAVIQALVPDSGPTGYRVVAGRGKADGSFTIEGVPDGVTYLLQYSLPGSISAYYVTTQHDIRLFAEVSGRCAPAPAIVAAPTPVKFQLTGMTPYTAGFASPDNIAVGSLALGFVTSVFPVAANDGDTTLATTYDWSQTGLAPLPDASAGDDLYVLHSRLAAAPTDPVTGRTHKGSRLLDTFQTTGVTLRDGVAATVGGAFQQPALNRTVSFSIDRGLFDAGRGGTAAPGTMSVQLTAQPVGHDAFLITGAALTDFELSDFSRSTSRVETVASFPYADPFPATWQRTVVIDVLETRSVRYPDPKSTGVTGIARNTGFDHLSFAYTGAIDATPMQKPTGVTLGGVDFLTGGRVAFDGQAPVVVTWNPVPSAISYRLDVKRVNRGGGTSSVALLRTADTSLRIPASLLGDGEFFVFLISATRSGADYGAGQISATVLPLEFASLASGRFRFSATCGDTVVQPGEDCDGGGETATCNRDCTTRFCGDGLRNATAGEACDTVEDALGCDSDCTLPVCGDGHLNTAAGEDCDDGNAIDDGNGCGANCKFNNVCGNHIFESAAEECDTGPGDSAACDADCTRVVCGDGHVNTAAGEECDDGNQDSTDHCSADCKILP
jgi:cysteine-rich repeat protein